MNFVFNNGRNRVLSQNRVLDVAQSGVAIYERDPENVVPPVKAYGERKK